MSDSIDRQAAIAEFDCCELTPDGGIDVNYAIDFLKQLPSAQPEGRSGVFIPDITVKNLRKAPLEAVEELLVLGEMEDIVLPSAQPERKAGKWLRSGSDIFPCECDRCGDTNERMTPWCPHCGAKMER